MHVPSGFVLGGAFAVESLIAEGSAFRVFRARAVSKDGPAAVAVKVPRCAAADTEETLRSAFARAHREWSAHVQMHVSGEGGAPLPLQLVTMYSADTALRAALRPHPALRSAVPYLVCGFAPGSGLGRALRDLELDEDQALRLALRAVELTRRAARAGVELGDVDPSAFVLDPGGERLTLVGLSPGATGDAGAGRAISAARAVVGLLTGFVPPRWPTEPEDGPRWERLLATRRLSAPLARVALAALGYDPVLEGSDAIEDRLRGLAQCPRLVAFPPAPRRGDVAYPIPPGTILGGRYAITGTLAQGGRGFIYEARDADTGVPVAIKANKYTYDSGSAFALELPTRRQELEHEWSVLRQIGPATALAPAPVALVRDRAFGPWFELAPALATAEPYIVMERVRGVALTRLLPAPLEGYGGHLIAQNRLPARLVARAVEQVASVLQALHARALLFQDLKTDNVLFDPEAESFLLVDFASACPRLTSGDLDKSHVAFAVQTHGFAAPEFNERWEHTDDRFDIYCVGATAYHLLTGICPERVAVDEGVEYPPLWLAPLDPVPEPVRDLVTEALAAAHARIPTATDLRARADRARLLLSRARPRDLRPVTVDYAVDGIALGLPNPRDPRITSIRVERSTRRDGHTRDDVLYDGPPVARVVDADALGVDRHYTITTAFDQGGRTRRSRGTVVSASATPAPARFSVTPWFGGNLIELEAAAQATAVVVRWSAGAPPLSPDDGAPLELSAGATGAPATAFHAAEAGCVIHYAAFARFGDSVSAPRFGSAAPHPPAPALAWFALRAVSEGVLASWDRPVSGLVLRATDGEDARDVHPDDGATSCVVPSRRDSHVSVDAFFQVAGARSEALARAASPTWPPDPVLSTRTGPGRVTVDDAGGSARFASFVVGCGAVSARAATLPITLDVAAEHVEIVVMALGADRDIEGPRVSLAADVAGLLVPTLHVASDELPVRLLVSVGPVPSASGTFTVEVWRGDTLRHRVTGALASLWGEDGSLPIEDADAAAGETYRYHARLTYPDGTVTESAEVEVLVRERLPAPRLAVLAGGATIEPLAGLTLIDVRFQAGAHTWTCAGVSPAERLDVPEGGEVEVRWRRHVGAVELPWSDASVVYVPRRPAPVCQARVDESGVVRRILWQPGDQDRVEATYEVRAGDRLVFRGTATEAEDWSGRGDTTYEVVAIRGEERSAGAVVEAPTRPTATGRPAQRSRSGAASAQDSAGAVGARWAQVTQAVRAGDCLYIEVMCRTRPLALRIRSATQALIAGQDARATGRGAPARAVRTFVVSSDRVVLPVRDPTGPIALDARPHGSDTPWIPVADIERQSELPSIDGHLIHATFDPAGALRLAAPPGIRQGILYAGDPPIPLDARLREGQLCVPCPAGGWPAPIRLHTTPPCLLIADRGGDLALDAWSDAAAGVFTMLTRALTRRRRAVVIATPPEGALRGTFDLVRIGTHARLTVTASVLDRHGRARIEAQLAAPTSTHARSVTVALDDATQAEHALDALAEWAAGVAPDPPSPETTAAS